MPELPLASVVSAALSLQGRREPALPLDGAPAEEIPKPTEVLLDALSLRSNATGGSALAPASQVAILINGVKNDDDFAVAYGASGVVDQLAPSFSKGIIGAGINVLVLGTGARQLSERNRSFLAGVDETLKQPTWDFGVVYRLTSLAQQFAVFWRTMGNAIYKSGMWVLKHAARVEALAGPTARVSEGIARFAATPVGRSLSFLNKWIPLLNAAWVMFAAKTAWDVNHDVKASGTSRAIAVGGVMASVAAVWAGMTMSGTAFMAVTAGSILCDMLLAESRYRDKKHGDTDQLAARWSTHPWEGAAAGGRWIVRVGKVIGGRAKQMLGWFTGEEPAKPAPVAKPLPAAATRPAPSAPVDPRRKLKIG